MVVDALLRRYALRMSIVLALAIALAADPQGSVSPAAPPAAIPATVVRPPLTFESPMPLPEIAEWARGEALDFKDATKTFLISFWSTAITPARESLPRLSKLADEYREQGLVVIAVTDEPAAAIAPMLEAPRFKEGVRFAIGCDPDRSTHRQFMDASWQNTLPTAFLARDGKILWIGNPRDIDSVLSAVFAGKWSTEGRRELYEQRMAATKRASDFEEKLAIFLDRKQWDAMLALVDQMAKDPNPSLAREGRLLRISTLQRSGRTAESLRECDALLRATKDWFVAAEIAKMLASPLFSKSEIARATVAALRAISLSKEHEALAYLALAEVQLRNGQRDLAQSTLKKALLIADPDDEDLIQERLAAAESGQPPTEANESEPAKPQ